MNMNIRINLFFCFLAIIFLLVIPNNTSAQNYTNINADHEHHEHADFEIGLGSGGFYAVNEEELAVGAHLHALYNLGKFGVGLGFEAVFFDVFHYGAGAILAYRPMEQIEFAASPGILFANEETGKNLFALHLEAMYMFEISETMHLGPVLGYGFAGADEHWFLGLHLGMGF